MINIMAAIKRFVSNCNNNINNYSILMLSLLLLTFVIQDIHCVRITSVNIPSYFVLDDNENTQEELILDCKYELNDTETDLFIKWFKDDQTIYHWIYGQKPVAYPQMKSRININYTASYEPTQEYRAISFYTNVSLDLSGDYKCLVQTAQSADTRISHLEILDMTNITIKLETLKRDQDTLITCSVANIKPKPTLEIRYNRTEPIEIDEEDVFNNTQGFFEVIVKGNISNDDIDTDDNEFGCFLSFEGTNYTKWYSEMNSGGIINYEPSIKSLLLSTMLIFSLTKFFSSLI